MIAKLLCATLPVLLLASQLVAAQAPTKAKRTQLRILDCTLETTTVDDCDVEGYVTRLFYYIMPGLIFGGLTLLWCPFYCAGKYCCNCCGGRNQSPGCCCPQSDVPMTYSSGDLIRNKLIMLLAMVLTGVAFIWGYAGSAQVTGGLKDFGDAISSIPAVLDVEIQAIDDALVLNQWNSTTNSTSPNRLFSTTGNATKRTAEDQRNTLASTIEDSLGDYNSRVADAKEALWFMFLIPLGCVTAGFVFGICNCRKVLPMMIVWFLFLLTFLIWMCHSLFGAAHHIFYDMCFEIDQISNQRANVIANVAGCEDSMFTDFRLSFKSLEITQAENTCNALATRCWVDSDSVATNLNNGNVYDCPSNLDCSGMTFATLVEHLETSFKIHTSIMTSPLDEARQARCRDTSEDCTVQRCAWDCAVADSEGGYLLEIGLTSAEVYATFLGAKQVSNAIDVLGAKYSSCDAAMRIVISVLDAPCQRLTGGLRNDMHASGLLAFAMTIGIFVYAWGAKRFISGSMAGKLLVDGEVVQDADCPNPPLK